MNLCLFLGLHALLIWVTGKFDRKAYWAYTIAYAIGTFGACQVPIVGLTPIKSLEQLGPCAVFFGCVMLHVSLTRQPRIERVMEGNGSWMGPPLRRLLMWCTWR